MFRHYRASNSTLVHRLTPKTGHLDPYPTPMTHFVNFQVSSLYNTIPAKQIAFSYVWTPTPLYTGTPPLQFLILILAKFFLCGIRCRTVKYLRKNVMPLVIEPELGVPFPLDTPYLDLKERAKYAGNTVKKLAEYGLPTEPTKADKDVAAKLVLAYAEDPKKTSKKVTAKKVATLTPASLLMTNSILQEFGQSVVESAVQIRHMVTNKLVLETDNPDARVRIRALELLGKISDVGLFAEKSEVTITHQSVEDLRDRLRSKLAKLINPEEKEEEEAAASIIIDGTVIDVDEELGIEDDQGKP
jgi:hypothetical protein